MSIILNRDVRNDNKEAVSQMALAAVLLTTKPSGMWRCGPDVVSLFHGQEVIFLTAFPEDVGIMIFRKVRDHSSNEYAIQRRGPEVF